MKVNGFYSQFSDIFTKETNFLPVFFPWTTKPSKIWATVKILKIGTPEIITIIVLQLEQLDFTVQYCVQKMQAE